MRLTVEEVNEIRRVLQGVFGPGTLEIESSRIFGRAVSYYPNQDCYPPYADFYIYERGGNLVLEEA